MAYKYIIFDVDDTLLNYGIAFYTAEKAIADYLKVEYSEEYMALSEKLGWKAWQDAGLNDTDSEDVQKHIMQALVWRNWLDYILGALPLPRFSWKNVPCRCIRSYLKNIDWFWLLMGLTGYKGKGYRHSCHIHIKLIFPKI